jgi:ribosomal-protein-alanine acetyltransferase
MRIRRATTADIPILKTLEEDAATASHWSEDQYRTILGNASPTRMALVIEDQQSTYGFLIARGVEREWEIENIAICASLRRRGLATRLLNEFIQTIRLQNAKAVFLEVRESNTAARRLYEKCGFEPTGRRHHYYRDPEEDAILFRLDFI